MQGQRKNGEDIDWIIKSQAISTVFQPIISLRDGSVLGHEALSRITCDTDIKTIDSLFQIADGLGKLWELELLCRTKALEAAYKFMVPPYDMKLFLNVNPNVIHDSKFKSGFTSEFLKQYQRKPENIVFEITEKNVVKDSESFISTIEHYKSQEFVIAIDDAGAGYSGLNLINDIRPSYIKIDMKLIRGIDTDSMKQSLVRGLVEMSKGTKIRLIAEGIETFQELDMLVQIGVPYGQGYFIQMPSPEIQKIGSDILRSIYVTNNGRNHIGVVPNTNLATANLALKHISKQVNVISSKTSIRYALGILKKSSDAYGLCIVDKGIPVGVLTLEKLIRKLGKQFDYLYYKNKPVSELMEKDFPVLDQETPLSIATYLVSSYKDKKLYDFVVLTENDNYVGIVTIRDLLLKNLEYEKEIIEHPFAMHYL